MASTKVQRKNSMFDNFKSFGHSVKTFFTNLVSAGEIIDGPAAETFNGTIERINEQQYARELRRKNSSSGRSSTLEKIEPDSPYKNMGVSEKNDDLDIGER